MSSKDKDFDYKRRFHKILWKMGFWARLEIPVLAYSMDTYYDNIKKHDITDLDVYGEMQNSDFSVNKYIVDCKSGKNVKSTERIFWLRGVMDYTKATKGFLIRESVSSNIRLILDKMDIYAVDGKSLEELEKLYKVDSINDLFTMHYYQEREAIIASLSDEYKKIFGFLNQRYWYNPSHINLRVMISMLNKGDFFKNFFPGNKVHAFLLLEVLILFSRLLFECCNYILHRNITDIPQGVLEFIHGGVNGLNNKKNIVREMKNIIQKHMVAEEVEISESDVIPSFYPPLTELIATLITEPMASKNVIKYLELFQHEIVLESDVDFRDVFQGEFSNVTLKLSKDIIRFYSSVSNTNLDIFRPFLNK